MMGDGPNPGIIPLLNGELFSRVRAMQVRGVISLKNVGHLQYQSMSTPSFAAGEAGQGDHGPSQLPRDIQRMH